jgi:hypothetical protein
MNSGDMGVNKTAFPAALEQSRCREQKGFVSIRDDAAISCGAHTKKCEAANFCLSDCNCKRVSRRSKGVYTGIVLAALSIWADCRPRSAGYRSRAIFVAAAIFAVAKFCVRPIADQKGKQGCK